MNRLFNSFSFGIPFLYTLLTTVSALPSGIWVIDIDNAPSPSAEDGPAFDRNAIRDPAYLPLQIGSIVGAYLLWIIVLSIAILTVGRRLRRQVQTSPRTLNMEIVRPDTRVVPMPQPMADSKEIAAEKIFEVTPISPTKDATWSVKSWNSNRKNNNRSATGSVMTFDESVLNDDRTRNEIEMDRLYAAVAAHEAQRSQPSSPPLPSLPPMTPLNQNPPEFQHLRYPGTHMHHDSGLLPSPPPEDDMDRSPTSPKSSTKRGQKPPPLSLHGSPSRGSSRSSFSSFASFGRKKTPLVRGLPISPPMGSPELTTDNRYLESAPLSPRNYRPGPPPTPPANPQFAQEQLASPAPIDEDGRKYYFSPGIRSSRASMSTFGYSPSQTPRTATFPIYPPPTVQEEQRQQNTNAIAITIDPSSAAPTPRAVPSTPLPTIQTQTLSNSQPQPPTPASPTNYSIPRFSPPRTGSTDTTRRPKPAPLSLGTASNSSQTTLPLRTAPLPFRALRSPNSTRPISTIKNTELTRPDPSSLARKQGGLKVPGTAGMVPATPYSPFYMPMTPLTPMTPSRLVTREERKRAKKEEGRRLLTQEDMVVDEEDMWGEGY
ncbi:MAG: hypothetical protein GOMPHAMPRED_003923 [Gomphillus americanus]|uniref:Uncharacterized protein n=1 Tax=Gomphillus americanus TaxID=1940652 RepID=A0A8H3FKR4_9LECA|nr:MAG: hypothetical protein GOMPHAMPRED_003923 [Gomphillus americanus]